MEPYSRKLSFEFSKIGLYTLFRRLILHVKFICLHVQTALRLKKHLTCVFFYVHKAPGILVKYWKIRCEVSFFSFFNHEASNPIKVSREQMETFFIIPELLPPRSSIMVSIGLLQCSTHHLSKCRVSFPFGRKIKKKKMKTWVLPETSVCSWTSEFSKRFVSRYSILRFTSMCFNFTKWKVYVICKLLPRSWLLEN